MKMPFSGALYHSIKNFTYCPINWKINKIFLLISDSEETQVSPPLSRLLQVLPSPEYGDDVQPLSLVLKKEPESGVSKVRPPAVKRHWKKFLKDQASITAPTNSCCIERPSPAKKFKNFPAQNDQQEEAENLCINDLSRTTESTVAQALLSLGRAPVRQGLPLQPLPLHTLQQQQQIFAPKFPFSSLSGEIRLPQHPAPFQYSNLFASQDQLHQPLPHQTPPSLTIKEFRPHHDEQALPADRVSAFSPPAVFENSVGSFRLSRLLLPTISESELQVRVPEPQVSKKPYFCVECKKGFSTQSGHIKHLELHRANQIQKTFSCKFCNKGYTSLSALKMHTRTHTLPCKCQICGKSFSRPWLLQGHVRTHTGEKPFSCGFCSRSFADKSNLRAHLQTHLQTKKYSCQRCHKTFSRMSLLNKHSETGCQIKIKTGDSGFSSGLIRA